MYDKDNDVNFIFNQDSREKKRNGIGIYSRASRKGFIRGGVRTPSDFMTTKQKKLLNGEVRTTNMYENYKTLENCNLDEILSKSDTEIKYILALIKKSFTSTKLSKQLGISVGKLYDIYTKYGVYVRDKSKINSKNLKDIFIDKTKLDKLPTIEKGKYFEKLVKQGYKNVDISDYYGISINVVANSRSRYKRNNENIKNIKNEIIENKIIENDNTIDPIELNELKEQIDRLKQENIELNKNITSLMTKKHDGLNLNFSGEYNKEELSNRLLSIDNITLPDKKYKIELSLNEVL